MFQGCFKKCSRMLLLHESFESITRKIEECFEGVLRVFHRSLKSISRKFQRWFSQVVGVLQVCFKEISRNLEGVLSFNLMFHDGFKVSSSMFHLFFKGFYLIFMSVSWIFKGCFKHALMNL